MAHYKFWHLLIRKRVRVGTGYHLRFDRRTEHEESPLGVLKDVLNHCGRLDLGISYNCIRSCEPVDSKEDDMIQVADILTGAVGFHWGDGHRDPKGSQSKMVLADKVARGIGRADLAFETGSGERRFNIWRFRPRPKQAP